MYSGDDKTIMEMQPKKCRNPYHKSFRKFRKQIRYMVRKTARGKPHSRSNFCKACQLTMVTNNDIQDNDARDCSMECNCCVEKMQVPFRTNTPIPKKMMIQNNNNLTRKEKYVSALEWISDCINSPMSPNCVSCSSLICDAFALLMESNKGESYAMFF